MQRLSRLCTLRAIGPRFARGLDAKPLDACVLSDRFLLVGTIDGLWALRLQQQRKQREAPDGMMEAAQTSEGEGVEEEDETLQEPVQLWSGVHVAQIHVATPPPKPFDEDAQEDEKVDGQLVVMRFVITHTTGGGTPASTAGASATLATAPFESTNAQPPQVVMFPLETLLKMCEWRHQTQVREHGPRLTLSRY